MAEVELRVPEKMASEEVKMNLDEEPQVIKEILSDYTKARLAENRKLAANDLYKKKKYIQALLLYSEAIKLCPNNATLYNNRAACHLMLNHYQEALKDCHKALTNDSSNVRALIREAKCYQLIGDVSAALRSLTRMRLVEPNSTELAKEQKAVERLQDIITESNKAYASSDYGRCIYFMEHAIALSPGCGKFKLVRAECLAHLGRLTEAREAALEQMRLDTSNADAWYIRGLALYLEDNLDKALKHFQQVTRLAPDHPKAARLFKLCKNLRMEKQQGNNLFTKGAFREAFAVYSNALNIDPTNKLTNAKIHCNRAQCSMRLERYNDALVDFNRAITLDANYIKAYVRRAQCYLQLDMFDEAVRDLEHAYRQDNSTENKRLLENAKCELRKSKRKDYYKILGIGRNANQDEIKKAYKKAALKHHPDRHARATEIEQRDQEKKFKELNEAYGVLSDPRKKSRYDSGVDMDDNGYEGSHVVSPHVHSFHTFFNNGLFANFGDSPGGFQFHFF